MANFQTGEPIAGLRVAARVTVDPQKLLTDPAFAASFRALIVSKLQTAEAHGGLQTIIVNSSRGSFPAKQFNALLDVVLEDLPGDH